MGKRLRRVAVYNEVYIICDGSGWSKIGYSSNARKRLRALQGANPCKLKLFVAIPVTNAPLIERNAHLLLAKRKRRGEWFEISDIGALNAVTSAITDAHASDLNSRDPISHRRPRNMPCFSKIARYGDKAYKLL